MTSVWQRRSGLVTSTEGGAGRARGFLEGALVVALIESEPEYPDAVTVTFAVDHSDRVAVVSDARDEIVTGPSLGEVAERLAEVCGGQVIVGGLVVGTETEASHDPGDPFDPEIGVVNAYVPDRSVVFTRGGLSAIGELAAAIGRPVLAAPHRDGHLVLVTDGPALSALEWPVSLQPVLLIEQGAAYPAVAVIDDGRGHLHTWDADATIVPADPSVDALVRPFADGVLGSGALVAQILAVQPDVDDVELRAAIEGAGAGPEALVKALGLPEELVGFLAHGDDVPQLEDARLVQLDHLGHALARAVTDASAQMTGSVREHTEQMRERAEQRAEQMRERAEQRAEQVRERADAARVRAESAFDAAETFTEEVVVPIRQSWWTPAAAAIEASVGGFLLYRAGRGARAETGTTAGERVVAVVGALLLVDAVVNTVVFAAPRLKRDL